MAMLDRLSGHKYEQVKMFDHTSRCIFLSFYHLMWEMNVPLI